MRAGPAPFTDAVDSLTRDAAARLAATPAGPALPPSPAPPPAAGPAVPADRLAGAGELVASAHPREALAALEAPFDSAADRARAGALRALALLAIGRSAEAAAAAREARGAGDAGTRGACTLVLARVAARDGRHADAIALYRELARLREPVPGLPARRQRDLPDDASFLAAWLPYDAGRYAEAARSLRAWLRTHPRARRADDARWFAAWSLVRSGARARGREALARLARGPDPLRAGALYWTARLDPRPVAQRALYRRAREASGPDAWYGQLAAARLAALGEAVPPPAVPGDGPPDPWGERLDPVAAGAGLDRHLLLALVRRESGFRTEARSAAGAEGLVQLLPDTAGRLATLAGVPAARAGLADPAAALPLGALYLGLLRDRLGSVPAALAGYNAGPEAAARWAADLAGRPLDEWVEDLPYRETRRYVKGVLADAQLYRWRAGRGELAIDGLAPVPPPGAGVGF